MISEEAIGLTRADFPVNFVWGTATAAYQIEGAVEEEGRGPSIWDTFSHTPGKIYNAQNGDLACDHYHRYREDVALMRQIGLNGYRFSISWPRIIPEGRGKVNQKGLDFYDRLVEELLENDVEPYATLYHWDLPQSLQNQGGWKNRMVAEVFAEYADAVSRRLGDRIKGWITLNEPWCSSVLGYLTGYHAPGEQDLAAGIQAAHHLLLGHGMVLPVLRRNNTRPDAEFGITLSLNFFEPGDDTPSAQEATDMFDAFSNRLFLDPLYKGVYPEVLQGGMFDHLIPVQSGDMDIISGTMDFLGVNYYFRQLPLALPADLDGLMKMHIKTRRPEGSRFTAMDWEVWPDGLYHLLKRLHHDYAPPKMYITENGSAFEDRLEEEQGLPVVHDPERLDYLRTHFMAANRAMGEGVPLAGYFVWSLLDNFEWAYGYSKRFGLTYVDYATQRRILKDSGKWYQQFLRG